MFDSSRALFELNGKLYCDPLEKVVCGNWELESAICKVSYGRKRIFSLSNLNAKVLNKSNLTIGEDIQLGLTVKPYDGTTYAYCEEMVRSLLSTKGMRGVVLGLPIGALLIAGASNDTVSWLLSLGYSHIHDIIDGDVLSDRQEYDRLDMCRSEIVSCLGEILTVEEKEAILSS